MAINDAYIHIYTYIFTHIYMCVFVHAIELFYKSTIIIQKFGCSLKKHDLSSPKL
jgi:hypothetical protein